MQQPRRRLATLVALGVSLLAAGLVADRLAWLAPLRIIVQRSPAQFPSSRAVPPGERARGGSLLSVYTSHRYLHHPDFGLLTNPWEAGRDWEHPATVSYFEDGDLRFASSAGLRLHGGTSRNNEPPSYRLYFRREYGSARFRPGTLFGGRGDPLTRLIAHNDVRFGFDNDDLPPDPDRGEQLWHLVNPLAFDIARRIGALAPETQPASFVLNGEPQGLFVLTEHVRRPFLVSRFGHDQFDRADEALFREWTRDVNEASSVTMSEADAWLDVESLTRWFVSIVFCGTSDAFQGVMFRDRTRPDARWFWVNWDMDHSFKDFYMTAPVAWRQDTFGGSLRSGAFEARLISWLVAEDPAYRAYLAAAFLEALNYRLTPSFLDERFRHYRAVAERFGLGNESYLEILEDFLRQRPAYVREMVMRYLDPSPLYRVRIEGPPGVGFRINDHAVTAGFSGWYPRGRRSGSDLRRSGVICPTGPWAAGRFPFPRSGSVSAAMSRSGRRFFPGVDRRREIRTASRGGLPVGDAVVGPLETRRDALPRVSRAHPRAGGAAYPRPKGRVAEKLVDGGGQPMGIALGDEQRGFPVDRHGTDAACPRGDHGRGGRQRFEDHVRQTVHVAGVVAY